MPDFGRVFLMLKYTDKTQNTYIKLYICGSVHRAFVVKIIPTRYNNCGLFFANAFTLHVSGDNPTHHQEYMCCIWPQVSRHTVN